MNSFIHEYVCTVIDIMFYPYHPAYIYNFMYLLLIT